MYTVILIYAVAHLLIVSFKFNHLTMNIMFGDYLEHLTLDTACKYLSGVFASNHFGPYHLKAFSAINSNRGQLR